MTNSDLGVKVAIMQPYLFPYMGYFQLIQAADFFVQFDDVNFQKKGWINRNQILLNGKPHKFVLPLVKASQNKLIQELDISDGSNSKLKLLAKIESAYRKAPQIESVLPVLSKIILYPANNLCDYLDNSIQQLCSFIGIATKILRSSELPETYIEDNAEERLINITKSLNGNTYVNASGALALGLYSTDNFNRAGIDLRFIQPGNIAYDQRSSEFVANLSIIDVLMFNTPEQVSTHLQNYSLVS